jgi:lauroyl/myristoyl acyltransferase
MSLSRFIQSPELLSRLGSTQPEELKCGIIDQTVSWFHRNMDAREIIERNLDRFGLKNSFAQTEAIIENVGIHYYEKLLPLCLRTVKFREFIDRNIDLSQAISFLREVSAKNRPLLCVTGHFGAVEFIAPSIASLGVSLSAVLRFTTSEFSESAKAHAQAFADSGLFAAISFIEIGRPGVSAALEMAAVLRRQGILMSVFDEETEYSIPVRLFNAGVMGGAGLHKLIEFSGASPDVFAAFMVRLPGGKYRLDMKRAEGNGKEAVQAMYSILEEHAKTFIEQWYFLHEEIPFCK